MGGGRDWEDGYDAGFASGVRRGYQQGKNDAIRSRTELQQSYPLDTRLVRKAKRKPSAWNKFVAANSKKKKYIYQSGAKRGKLNLKKMGVDYRKKKR